MVFLTTFRKISSLNRMEISQSDGIIGGGDGLVDTTDIPTPREALVFGEVWS